MIAQKLIYSFIAWELTDTENTALKIVLLGPVAIVLVIQAIMIRILKEGGFIAFAKSLYESPFLQK